MDRLVKDLKEEAGRMGIGQLGIAGPGPSAHLEFFQEWIDRGYHGEMAYLARPDAVGRRGGLAETMPHVRSVVVVAQDHFQADPPGVPGDPSRGVVARYARGRDYHEVLKDRLGELLRWIREEARGRGLAQDVKGFPYVDTGPILERDLGNRAGLGWFGRNTMLIHPRRGSYFFLGILLLDLPLPPDPPFRENRCGSCVRCLDACPTRALLGRDATGAPVIDSRRCISYLTIEHRGPIPRGLRALVGNRIFGCDICQEVCPWNSRFATPAHEPAYAAGPDTDGPALIELMELTDEEFSARFSGSPVKRTKRRGLLRNVAVAVGNWGSRVAVPALTRALEDPEPLVRGHAAWALGRIGGSATPGAPEPERSRTVARTEAGGETGEGPADAERALLDRMGREEDAWVREELRLASGVAGAPGDR